VGAIAFFLLSVLAFHTEESLSLIHSRQTFPATLATPQSAAVTAGCDRTYPRQSP
jgi:hypothetical protein